MKQEAVKNNRRRFTGKVVSTKMKDTVVVCVESYRKYPKYEKFFLQKARYQAHDPGNTATLGEKVVIEECAPISKHKKFKVVERVGKQS
ncbi:MAG: 30S ribosomal protein S17 [Patescibacteria group bacterium]